MPSVRQENGAMQKSPTWLTAKRVSLVGIFVVLVAARSDLAADPLPAKPPGKFFPLKAEDHRGAASYKKGEPVVGTSYFYWYDIDGKGHILNGDGSDALTNHPADMKDISFKRASWHATQLRDMIAAGIDFLMPVYWGVPGKYDGWSFVGLPPLVEAHNALQKEGLRPPGIGLFYDTSILQHNGFNPDGSSLHVDLTTDLGKAWFYTAMRDFFSLIPPAKWARVDGKPIVFLYAAGFAKAQDPAALSYVRERFRADFGTDVFLVKMRDWQGTADAIYQWGGAVSLQVDDQVAALGPGYDHSAVPGRAPLIVRRRDGETYTGWWSQILRLDPKRRPWMVHVETWNEWHEGTDVAASREYGRSYIVLTGIFSSLWKQGVQLGIRGPYTGASYIAWESGRSGGVTVGESIGDGVWKTQKFGEVEAVVSQKNTVSPGRYLYFKVDDSFALDLPGDTVDVTITYRDAGCAVFGLEYDNVDRTVGPVDGAFRPGGAVTLTGSGEWKTASFTLSQCRFANRCNGADLRFAVSGGEQELAVSKVTVRKK
jgi:hypothetical protein